MFNHELFMQRCLQLAAIGQQWVAPNPMVGAVVVKNGKIIGEGYHKKIGGPHAEVNAIESVEHKNSLKGATLYVSLEPCVHHGKTPPCTNLIIEHHISKVVVACLDPNPLVAGKGVKQLENAGIEVIVGVLAEEAKALNKRFMHFHTYKTPFVVLKWAQTADGFCGRIEGAKLENKITNWYSNLIVHQLRSTETAIMVGFNTAKTDNPVLTNRNWFGQHPLRIVIDIDGELPQHLHVFNDQIETLIFTTKLKENKAMTSYIEIAERENLVEEILLECYKRKIQSILLEGGPKTLQKFIDKNAWNEAHVFTSDKAWGSGIKAPSLKAETEIFHQNAFNDQYQIFKSAQNL